jgi:hypothetical protein
LHVSIWGTCPKTKPSLLHADDWLSIFSSDLSWDDCGKYLKEYDCVKIMGFGNSTIGEGFELFAPGKFPENGTATLSNVDGTISSPVSGATFTWQNKDSPRTIVAFSKDERPETESATTASQGKSAVASNTGTASSLPTGAGTDIRTEGKSSWLLLSAVAVWYVS